MNLSAKVAQEKLKQANEKRLALLLRQTSITGFLSICLAMLLTFLMRTTEQTNTMIVWVALLAGVFGIRWFFFYRNIYRDRHQGIYQFKKHHTTIVVFLFISGCIWGIGAYLFFPQKTDIELFVTFATFMVGISAGLLPSFVTSLPAYLAFLVPMMIGVSLRIYLFEQYVLLASVAVYSAYLIITASKLCKAVTKAISIDVENVQLLKQVIKEKASADNYANDIEKMLENKKQLLADVSHELRTPLAVIKVYLEALVDGIEQDKDSYPIMQRKVEQLERLIQDIYLLSKTNVNQLEIEKENFTIDSLLQELAGTFTPLTEKQNLSLNIYCYLPYDVSVEGDWLRLIQAFSNVLQNSINYTNEGGNIQITANKQERGVLIQIDDSAPDVPAEKLDKLFDRFYRVESSRNRATGGSGLGLSITKAIIEAHNGRISLTPSNIGGLSTKIYLPSI